MGSARYGNKKFLMTETCSVISNFRTAWYIPGGAIPEIEESDVHLHCRNTRFVAYNVTEFSNGPNDLPLKTTRTYPVIGILGGKTE